MQWLGNKQWLFCALVVVAFLRLGQLLRRRRIRPELLSFPSPFSLSDISARQNSSMLGLPVAGAKNICQTDASVAHPQEQKSTSAGYSNKPTPEEITTQVESVPLFQRDAAREAYCSMS